MACIIERHITRRYEVTDIARFMKFSVFHDARKNMRDNPTTCFKCHHKFDDDEYIYLGIVKGGNRIFCKACAEQISKELGQDELKKIR